MDARLPGCGIGMGFYDALHPSGGHPSSSTRSSHLAIASPRQAAQAAARVLVQRHGHVTQSKLCGAVSHQCHWERLVLFIDWQSWLVDSILRSCFCSFFLSSCSCQGSGILGKGKTRGTEEETGGGGRGGISCVYQGNGVALKGRIGKK